MRKDSFRDFVLEQLADLRGMDCEAIFTGYALRCDKTLPLRMVDAGRFCTFA